MKELTALARVSAHRLDREESREEDNTGKHFHSRNTYVPVCVKPFITPRFGRS